MTSIDDINSTLKGGVQALGTLVTAVQSINTTLSTTSGTTGSVVHTPFVNILDHGGVADGATDNTAALTAAYAAVGTRGGTIYFPQGKYLFSAQQTLNYPASDAIFNLTLLGDGEDATVLYWANSNGIQINYINDSANTCNQSFHARDLALTTGTTAVNGFNALILTQTVAGNGSFAAFNELTRVTFRGDDGVVSINSWGVDCQIAGVSNIDVTGCFFCGAAAAAGKGLTYQGISTTSVAVVLNVTGCTFNQKTAGFEIENAFTQGVTFSQCNWAGCLTSINIPAIATASLLNGVALAQLAVSDSQFGQFATGNGIFAHAQCPISQLMLNNNLFLLAGANATIAMGGVVAPMQNFAIVGNVFQSSFSTVTTGLQVTSGTAGILTGNTFVNLASGITLQAGAAEVNIGPNKFYLCTLNVTNGAAAANNNFGTWYHSVNAGFIASFANQGGAVGDDGIVIAAGTNGTSADSSTVSVLFTDALQQVQLGAISRSDGTGLAYSGTNLSIINGTSTHNITARAPANGTSFAAVIGNTRGTSNAHGLVVLAGTGSTGGDTASFCIYFSGPDFAQAGNIRRNDAGATLQVAFNTTSDRRLKSDIRQTERGLSDLQRIRVIDYGPVDHHRAQAFVAQEVYEIYPEAVSPGGDDARTEPWSMDYGRMTPLLARSIQDLADEVKELRERVDGIDR